MATWPESLPRPQRNGYALETGDGTVRTDVDTGPARVRRRYTAVADQLTLRFSMSKSQMVTFREFWDGEANGGASWFFMPLIDGRSESWASKEVRPNPAKFKSVPEGGGRWMVSFNVEVRNA